MQHFCLKQGLNKTYWVAYSGGLDSHVLLHLFANLRSIYPIQLRAIHVNHSLSVHAPDWVRHCEQVCQDLNIDLLSLTVNAKSKSGESPEAIAREKRYALFSEVINTNDLLLTAHHQNDQAETLLLQLCRGAGPKGLAAMPSMKPLASGFLARPLLDFTQADLKAYAEENQLHWIEDESNANKGFSRNFIRHEIIPLLEKRWPSVVPTLARVSAHCAEAQPLLDEVAAEDLLSVQGSLSETLSVEKLRALSASRQRQVLRLWLKQLGFSVPSTIKIHQIQKDILQSDSDKMPLITWSGVVLRRYQDNIYATPPDHFHEKNSVQPWDMLRPLLIPGLGLLQASATIGQGLRADLKAVTVRFRQGGEVCRLPGRTCHHRLKNLFQEWHIPPWERDRIPFIFVEDQLAVVVGLFVCEGFEAKGSEAGFLLSLDKK